jgi:hypothetical protein
MGGGPDASGPVGGADAGERNGAVTWTWRYEADDGSPVAVAGSWVSESFPTQGDAETWIGESWRDLLDVGVTQVTLLDAGRRAYGPMGLRPVS